MSLYNGERQVAPTVAGIRADHRARYEWAANRFSEQYVVDAACGVGYGAKILADRGCIVRGFDRSTEAIDYAKEHYNHNPHVKFVVGDLYEAKHPRNADVVLCFEALEHLTKPEIALHRFRGMAPNLVVSVPNEDKFPFKGYAHHVRHYTKSELQTLLETNGWHVTEWWGQEGPESPVEHDKAGRTLIAVAERDEHKPKPLPQSEPDSVLREHFANGVPNSVAIVAMGRSSTQYFRAAASKGDRKHLVDETWAINAMGGVIDCDRIFAMDDVKVQEARAELDHDKHVKGMLGWQRSGAVPVYTSRTYDDYEALVEYPLEWVASEMRSAYFNSTIPYAVAFAIAAGVKRIHLYGCDYSYKENRHKGEKGRACLEFWIGKASERGVTFVVPDRISTLLDADVPPHERLYGYDTEWVTLEPTEDGFRVARTPRKPEDIPTAQQMEYRYSHDPSLEPLARRKE